MEDTNTPERPVRPVREGEIDLLELGRKAWAGRKLILKCCGVAAVIGLIVGFSIPKEYTTTVKLAPEMSSAKNSLGGLSTLASMAGVNMSSSGSADAVYPGLYPDVVASVPFAAELFRVQVATRKGDVETDVYDYLLNHTKRPWWSAVTSLPFKAVGWVMSWFAEDKPATERGEVDTFRLTRKENAVVKMLNNRINVIVDKKSVVTLSVTMQDPLISATLTDTVLSNLQNYITAYRTDKARRDLTFTQKLFDEAQREYYDAQQKYAHYMDANQDVILRSVRTEQERLQNEMNLAYNIYNQMAGQLQMARAKVQESTPVYAVVQPASVPVSASKPSKMLILIGFVCLGGIVGCAWVLFGKDAVKQLKKE